MRGIQAEEARLAQLHNGTVVRSYESSGIASAKLSPAAVEALRRNPNVELVVPDAPLARASHMTQTNAPWGLDRIDQQEGVGALNQTYEYTLDGSGVNIYVIDSGIHDHAQFSSDDTSRINRKPGQYYDVFGGNGFDCVGDGGHGTQVASTAAGNSLGVARGSTIHPVKMVDCGAPFTSDLIAAINWVKNNARKPAVANISIHAVKDCDDDDDTGGGGDDGPGEYNTTSTPQKCGTIHNQLDNAVKDLVASGVSVVVAAGNYNQNSCEVSPGRLSEVITVGATDKWDGRWTKSNHGSCVDIFAPGAEILVAKPSLGTTLTGTVDGTSIAAGFATGAVALYLQREPNATPTMAKNAMINSSTQGVLSNLTPSSPNRLLLAIERVVASFNGPTRLDSAGTYSWTASPRGGIGHYTTHWYKRLVFGDGSRGSLEDLGPGPTITLSFGPNDHDIEFELRATSGGQTATRLIHIMSPCHKTICPQSTGPAAGM